MLSVILPAYNEENMILRSASVVGELLGKYEIPYEILFIDDGSKDTTWEKVREAHRQDKRVRGVSFSRNFGKEAAIYAGLAAARGEAAAVMDCDLQHPPEKLVEMYGLWKQGYEVIEGVKTDRGEESALHRWLAGLFYSMMSGAVGIDMRNASDFKLLDRRVVDTLCGMEEKNTFFRALSSWVGYRKATVYFEVRERTEGATKWSLKALLRYALDNITAFTALPLQFVTISGAATLLLASVLGIHTLIRYAKGNSVAGFPTVILLLLFIGSVIMISLGIIGYYLSKMNEEIKRRPKYIVSEEV